MTSQSLPSQVLERLGLSAPLPGLTLPTRSGDIVEDSARYRSPIEVRTESDGSVSIAGYATTWDTQYEVAGGPPLGFMESISRGAANKTLNERADVRFLINHDGLPLARSKSGTLSLRADDMGLLIEVRNLDMANPRAQELVSAVSRGDVDQMSVGMQVTRQKWNKDYTERDVQEIRLLDVSAVAYPANPATVLALRTEEDPVDEQRIADVGMSLAYAQAILLTL